MLVEVRPIDVNKWHGKKGKESFTRPKGVEVLYDPATGKYATGLTEAEALEYSKQLGVDLSDRFNPNEPHPYWSTKAAFVKLPNHTLIFNTDRPIEYVKIKNLKASKLVANSTKELKQGLWPEATHVIYDEAEEVEAKASKIQLKQKAIVLATKMTAADKASMIQILSNRTVKGQSDNFMNVEIDELIEKDPAEFLKVCGLGREEVSIRSTVLELIGKGTLTKEAGSIYYMGELIGYDYENAIEWFKDPHNQRMKVAILEKLQK